MSPLLPSSPLTRQQPGALSVFFRSLVETAEENSGCLLGSCLQAIAPFYLVLTLPAGEAQYPSNKIRRLSSLLMIKCYERVEKHSGRFLFNHVSKKITKSMCVSKTISIAKFSSVLWNNLKVALTPLMQL